MAATTTTDERDTRLRLLDVAEDLFARSGYDAVGVQEIVSSAGVTKPTLYHHFGSKLGLLDALLGERLGPWLAELAEVPSHREDIAGALTRVAGSYFRFARSRPVLYRLHLALWFASPASPAAGVVRPLVEAQTAVLDEVFRAAAERHGNMRGRHAAYAATFLGVLNARIALAQDRGEVLGDGDVWLTVQQFSYGIYT
jgi:AcrR family transcriptional regulator